MESQCRSPLRGRVGKIQNLGDLRRAGALLAGHLGLPRAPYIEVGDVSGAPIDFSLAGVGVFKILRWAVRGDHRRSWDELEHMLVLGIGAWLESECRRRGSTFVGNRAELHTRTDWTRARICAARDVVSNQSYQVARFVLPWFCPVIGALTAFLPEGSQRLALLAVRQSCYWI